jgi:hypothetical protein
MGSDSTVRKACGDVSDFVYGFGVKKPSYDTFDRSEAVFRFTVELAP